MDYSPSGGVGLPAPGRLSFSLSSMLWCSKTCASVKELWTESQWKVALQK